MKRKRQKKEEIDNYYKDWFENLLQPWDFRTLSGIYDELEEQLTEVEREMRYIFRETASRMFPSPEDRNPYFYKLPVFITTKRMSPINGFGNIIRSETPHEMLETKEPFVEVIESDKIVSITSELPGFAKENIELEITQDTVIIKVNNGKENYYKKVELPCNVHVDSSITIYQNGILDIELKKSDVREGEENKS